LATEYVKLMIPGPVGVEDEVLAAMAEPVRAHYGEAWIEIYDETLERLQRIFGSKNEPILMIGPGSVGMEAAIGSLAGRGDKVLFAYNGFFGRRMSVIGRSHGLEVLTVEAPLGEAVDPDAIRQKLAAERDIQALAFVHLETSTGVLNPLREIVSVADEYGVPIILDAISTLGGVPLPVDEWGIDICVTVGNKCLAGPIGLVPVSISQRAWDQMERKREGAHGWYLNLRTWKDYKTLWGPHHPYPTTLPTHNILGLLVSLRLIEEQGLEAYHARHVEAAQYVRSGLRKMGFEMLMPEANASPLITTVRRLPGMDVEDFRRYLLERWQIMIGGGLEEGLRGEVLRIGHIGKAASAEYCELFLDGVEAYRKLQGYDMPTA
jgi:alanine-glyoxylate transaminase/serine-glyoxylate transaminase/serine-pyruvate transaminase